MNNQRSLYGAVKKYGISGTILLPLVGTYIHTYIHTYTHTYVRIYLLGLKQIFGSVLIGIAQSAPNITMKY